MTDEFIDPSGLRLCVIVSAGDISCRGKLPQPSDACFVASYSWLRRTYRCGHRAPRKFTLSVYGATIKSLDVYGKCPACCLKEIAETVIRCASCGLSIFVGDPVALYHPQTEGLDLSIATFASKHAVVGCLRWDCCAMPGLFAGHWMIDGFAQFPFDDE